MVPPTSIVTFLVLQSIKGVPALELPVLQVTMAIFVLNNQHGTKDTRPSFHNPSQYLYLYLPQQQWVSTLPWFVPANSYTNAEICENPKASSAPLLFKAKPTVQQKSRLFAMGFIPVIFVLRNDSHEDHCTFFLKFSNPHDTREKKPLWPSPIHKVGSGWDLTSTSS